MSEHNNKSDLLQEISTEEEQLLSGGHRRWGYGPGWGWGPPYPGWGWGPPYPGWGWGSPGWW